MLIYVSIESSMMLKHEQDVAKTYALLITDIVFNAEPSTRHLARRRELPSCTGRWIQLSSATLPMIGNTFLK